MGRFTTAVTYSALFKETFLLVASTSRCPLSEDDHSIVQPIIFEGTSKSSTKVFTVNIKHGTPVIGRIFAKTQKGEIIDDGDSLIIDLYSVYREPEIFVENGLDYNGKLLNKDLYTVDTTYMFAVRNIRRVAAFNCCS